jgi:hypothetical protein
MTVLVALPRRLQTSLYPFHSEASPPSYIRDGGLFGFFHYRWVAHGRFLHFRRLPLTAGGLGNVISLYKRFPISYLRFLSKNRLGNI